MKRIMAGKIMMALVLIAVLGALCKAYYYPAEFSLKTKAALILGVLLWSLVALVLIRSRKKAGKDKRIPQDKKQYCLSCGRWVPATYLNEGRYCYACFGKIKSVEEEKTREEGRHRESIQNVIAGREPFPYQAELDRRVFEFLANEEERDQATMVQAMVESDGNEQRAKAIYFKLRYKQMDQAGEFARFMEEILEQKARPPGDSQNRYKWPPDIEPKEAKTMP